jgi:uncharacterized membrane protein YcaP (DUF421 family)
MATIVHAVAGYFFLLLTVRMLKRRAGSQMALFEFVIVFLIGGVIILSTVGNDRSVTNCTCAVIAVSLMHRLVAWGRSKSPRFGAIIDGTPLVMLKDGEWQREVMEGMRLKEQDVQTAARTNGHGSMDDVAYAVLERNGRISIIPKES